MIKLTKEQILLLHTQLIEITGGSDGIRDIGLLESALESPFQSYGGVELYPSIQAKTNLLPFHRKTDIIYIGNGKYSERFFARKSEVMVMTIGEFMQEKGLSRYRLAKISGVPWATLSDICSGKTKFERCSAATLSKLSKALGVTMEEMLLLETGNDLDEAGKPKNKRYLEKDLPESLQKSLEEYIQGEKEQAAYLDCLWGELYGSINSCQWGGRITEEQADYLRKKYLFAGQEEEDDD